MVGLRARVLSSALALFGVLGCRGTGAPSTLSHGRPPMPQLPPELRVEFGTLHAEAAALHNQPLPLMADAPATAEQHTQWVDTVLEPWRAKVHRLTAAIFEHGEEPVGDPDDAAMRAYFRARLVQQAMFAALLIDERIAQLTIPIPTSTSLDDPETREMLRGVARAMAQQTSRDAETHRSGCTYAWGEDATPAELVQWQEFCFSMVELLVDYGCENEKRFAPDVVDPNCAGRRPPPMVVD